MTEKLSTKDSILLVIMGYCTGALFAGTNMGIENIIYFVLALFATIFYKTK